MSSPILVPEKGRLRATVSAVHLAILLAVSSGAEALLTTALAEKLPDWMRELDVEEGLDTFPDAEIVQLFSSTSLKVEESGKRTVRARSAFHVRQGEADGYDVAGVTENLWRKSKGLKGWRRDSSGEVESFDDVLTTQAGGGELYSDSKEIHLLIPGIEEGDLFGFELRYEQDLPELSTHRNMIRGRIPLLQGQFELELPERWSVEALWYDPIEDRATPFEPIFADKDHRIWSWSSQAGSEDPEPFEPSDSRLIPWYAIRYHDPSGRAATMNEWKVIAEWGQAFSASALEDQAHLRQAALEIVGDAQRPADQIERIAEFVRSSIGYVQIYLGDGGWRPHPAELVYMNRYGDCKDMAHLAVALFRSLELNAYPVWTCTQDGAVWRDFPDDHFNHCIVAIDDPDGTEPFCFFDPTAKSVPYGWLPASLEGAWALVLGSGFDSALVRMPTTKARENLKRVRISSTLSTDLSCFGSVEEILIGHSAFRYKDRVGGETNEERRQAYERHLGRQFPGARVGNFSLSGLDQGTDTLRYRYEFAIPQYARKAGRLVLLSPDFLTAYDEEIFPAAERKTAIVNAYPYRTETTIELILPPGWGPEEAPAEVRIENAYGKYERTYSVAADSLHLSRVEQIDLYELPPEQYDLAYEWGHAVYMADREKIVLGQP